MAAEKESVAYFCPRCGSASLDFSSIEGGQTTCRSCAWTGSSQERVAYPFKHDYFSDESVLRQAVQELREVLLTSSGSLARYLVHWGFFTLAAGEKQAARDLARYLARAVQATLTAFIEERERIEKERCGGG